MRSLCLSARKLFARFSTDRLEAPFLLVELIISFGNAQTIFVFAGEATLDARLFDPHRLLLEGK